VLILIDISASHDFISQELVQQLGLKVTPTQTYGLRLSDGNKKNAQGCCEQMEIQLGQMTITEKLFLFDLGGVYVILGIAGLKKLGDVKVNWKFLTMQFKSKDN